ncbi:MAG: hypothetical protein ABI836_09050 [Gemmatimonadota bacterium]
MRLRHRFPQVLCLLAALSGCMGWHTSTVDPATLIDRDHPGAVRITRQDRSRVIMYKPVVEGDSLRGREGRHPVALPLSDVSSVAVQKMRVGATVFSVVLVAGVIAVVVGLSSMCLVCQ